MKWDLNGVPVSSEQIDAQRVKLNSLLRWSSWAPSTVPPVLLGVLVWLSWGTSASLSVVALIIPIPVFFVIVVWRGTLSASVEALSEIDSSRVKRALDLVRTHPDLDEFRLRVIASGRKLTNGELDEMEAAVEQEGPRNAVDLLHQSVPASRISIP